MIPAEAVAGWLRARGRDVAMLDAPAIVSAAAPFRPIAASTLLVQRRGRPVVMMLAVTRTTAAWSVHASCWTHSVAGSELDALQHAAARDASPARVLLLAMGGGDRALAKAPRPPRGLFIATAGIIEATALRSFGHGADRRCIVRVDQWPWRRLASLEDLGLPA